MTAKRGLGETVLQLLGSPDENDLLYMADDEQEAQAVAAALSALAPKRHVVFVPSSDTLPGDGAPASPANVGRRVAALRHLRTLMSEEGRSSLITVLSGEAAARLYADPCAFDAAPPRLRQGEAVDMESFAASMEALGYVVDDRVDEPGEVAVRGGVIDIFPADAGLPARIDVAEGRIIGIRRYDPMTQLTRETCEALDIGRAIEPQSRKTVTILAHLRPGHLYVGQHAEHQRQRFYRLAKQAAGAEAKVDAATPAHWSKHIAAWVEKVCSATITGVPRFVEQRAALGALHRFALPHLEQGKRLLLVGSQRDVRFLKAKIEKSFGKRIETVDGMEAVFALPPGALAALSAPVDGGAMSEKLLLIAAADLLGSRAITGEAPVTSMTVLGRADGDIRAGDVIVHQDHGVGKVIGLEPAPGEDDAELIALEYDRGARRLVPIHEARRIWRYGADAGAVKLDTLSGSSWEKRRHAIDEELAASARALTKLARERARLEAPVLDPDPIAYERFVATFPFNETVDQARTIQAVRDDLASGRPMDRLVVGDVGYGKTEIALRAAALAALAGHQVVLAAPTTILVRQHLQSFQRRFAGFGLNVASLSRLSSAAQKKSVKTGLAEGSIHIVIGTGAVMANDVRYARLGLVIIDEEQRFGAADKTRLRGDATVHLLAMSATPIPRTLHRAMIGLQQISIIATPPARRQPIRTSIAPPDDTMIRTALLREKSRGGQSFVVVPRVEDLGPLSERLMRIVPTLRKIEAHGKMAPAQIDEAMVCFSDGDGDILLATNIIEAGLDVPRANTMIVWRADRFGLAQLHQLRGRVGRGNRRGQVILITEKVIAERTMKRLRTLATYDRLGAGFEISAADLDQRGAGDPLAQTQAGHMKLIGVDLYQHLFEAALRHARGEDATLWQPNINIGNVGAFPSSWIPDDDVRLGLYVKLAHIALEGDLDSLEAELLDRFGPLPPAGQKLIEAARITILARKADIERIDAGPGGIALTPRDQKRKLPPSLNLTRKGGRWLLKEQHQGITLPARIVALLERLLRPEGR